MGMTKRFWIGAAFLAAGIAAYFAFNSWLHTRTWQPVYMPVDLTTGTVRSLEFTPNVSVNYEVRIEASTRGKLPAKIVACLLNAQTNAKECPLPPALSVGWVLTSHEKMLEHGSTEDKDCCETATSNGAISRTIGRFHAEKGRSYVLLLNVLEDGTALGAADPHLIVDYPAFSKSGGGQLTVVQFFCVASAIFGLFLMVPSWMAGRKQNGEAQ